MSPGRRFSDCVSEEAVGQQQRAGRAVLLAFVFDVRVVGPNGEPDLTLVVDGG